MIAVAHEYFRVGPLKDNLVAEREQGQDTGNEKDSLAAELGIMQAEIDSITAVLFNERKMNGKDQMELRAYKNVYLKSSQEVQNRVDGLFKKEMAALKNEAANAATLNKNDGVEKTEEPKKSDESENEDGEGEVKGSPPTLIKGEKKVESDPNPADSLNANNANAGVPTQITPTDDNASDN
jgi:hypothetical protein